MADLRLVWNQALGRADWTVVPAASGAQLAASSDMASVVLLLLFTDRVAQPDYPGPNRHGWWADSFQDTPVGSRLWQLERRKIADRGALAAEAKGIVDEALAPMVAWGIASSVTCQVACPPAGIGSPGTLLVISILVTAPSGATTALTYGLRGPGSGSGAGGAGSSTTLTPAVLGTFVLGEDVLG